MVMRYIIGNLILLLMLTACSSSNDEVEPQVQMPQVPEREQPEGNFSLVSFRRTGSAMTVTDDYSPVALFLVGEGTDGTQQGKFIYKQNDQLWHSSLTVTSNRNYAIFGYAPTDAVTADISSQTLTGATLTFSNLHSVSTQDVCFVVGVQQLNAKTDDKNIPLGRFLFTGKADVNGENQNFVNILMDHLYAGLRLRMTIDADYAKLRSIKIRRLELKSTKSTAQAVVVLASNTTQSDPVQSVAYSGLTDTERTVTFFESTEGVALTATATEQTGATCCFVPTLSNDLSLVATYDVYDKNDNKIDERTATNKLPNMNAARGERVTLTLNVKPTYLGVLSDPDLDNPTVTVN